MNKMIVTVGRSVYYYASQADRDAGIIQKDRDPLPGVVAAVFGEDKVTLAAFDAHGIAFSAREVEFRNEEQSKEEQEKGGFACWMPYQLGQAQTTAQVIEDAQKKLENKEPGKSQDQVKK